MRKILFFKIFSGYVVIILLVFLYFFFLSSKTTRDHYIETLKKDLLEFAVPLANLIEEPFKAGHYDDLDAMVKRIGSQTDRRITVIDVSGRVMADSWTNPALMENHRNRPEIIQAFSTGRGSSLRYSETIQEKMLYVAVPLVENDRNLAIIRVSVSLRSINELLQDLKRKFYLLSSIYFCIFSFVSFIVSRRLYRPIHQLNEALKRVTKGDMEMKVILKTRDELRELAENYNLMAESIKSYMHKLSTKTEELNAIISSMHPGLIVIDSNGVIALHNESAKMMLKKADLEGRFYWQVFREVDFLDLIQQAQKEKVSITREIKINGCFLKVNATYIDSLKSVVMNLQDITDIRNLEKIKRDFVVNVSHELRTPLTAIKGYLETINVKGEDRNYLEIIKRHTDRLVRIVEDLLTLSELEEKGVRLENENVDLKAIVENVIKMFERKIKEKGLGIKSIIEEGLPLVTGDFFKLEQVFVNIIDNAIKYTDQGEVIITLRKVDGYVRAEIKDTGIGIPEKHLSRIFERFYTVDKSHSRKLGGTGLGLSIVKHIVSLHGGRVDVKSKPGEGTIIGVEIPVFAKGPG